MGRKRAKEGRQIDPSRHGQVAPRTRGSRADGEFGPRRQIEAQLLRIEPGVEELERDGSRRQAGEAEDSGVVGERHAVGAAQRDAGVGQVLAGDGVLHAAGDGGGLGGDRGRDQQRQQEETAEQRGHGVGETSEGIATYFQVSGLQR